MKNQSGTVKNHETNLGTMYRVVTGGYRVVTGGGRSDDFSCTQTNAHFIIIYISSSSPLSSS